MKTAITILLGTVLAIGIASCGPSMQNTVTMRCGENQSATIGSHRCVVITRSDGDCPVQVTAQCKDESPKSTTVSPGGSAGRLCCTKAIGRVIFTTVGKSSGTCKFTYGRDN